MNQEVDTGGEIVEYLLGSLQEDRMEAIEQRILTDDDFHFEVEAAETELLDKYVYGELDHRACRLFQQNFLKSDLRRRKLQFALALKAKLAADKPPALQWFRGPYALAASLLVAAGLGVANLNLTRQLNRQQERVAELNRQVEAARNAGGAPGAWSSQDAILVAKLERANREEEMAEINVPGGVRGIQFVLAAPAALQGKAEVKLLDDGGRIITAVSGIELQEIGGKRVLIATFSAQQFRSANYFVDVVDESPGSAPTRYALKVRTESSRNKN